MLAQVDAAEIHEAAAGGDLEKVRVLLKSNPAWITLVDDMGNTPLHSAAQRGHEAVARWLLDRKAKVNARGPHDETPLHLAMEDGHLEMAVLLLEHKANINAVGIGGETPLHLAVFQGHRELVERLLTRGADANAADRQGVTALHVAATKGQVVIVKLLLTHKADLRAKDGAGKTAEALAAENNHAEILALLRSHSPVPAAQPAGAAGRRVGRLSDVRRITFVGAETFSPEALRLGLTTTPGFLQISHPYAPLTDYLAAIENNLRVGYQHSGFPAPRISAHHDENAGLVVVKVEAGPRYRCGGVKVTGLRKMATAPIIARLTNPQVRTQSVASSIQIMDAPAAMKPLNESDLQELGGLASIWIQGQPAHFSDFALRQMTMQITNTLREHGFCFSRVRVRIEPDKKTGGAELRVHIEDEGPRGVIDRIEIIGNRKNTREALLRHLNLKPGMVLTSGLVAEIERELRDSARFLSSSVATGLPDDQGRLLLQIVLMEYEQAPAWDAEFSRAQKTFLRAREWLVNQGLAREDLVIDVDNAALLPGISARFVLSPRQGFGWAMNSATTNGRAFVNAVIIQTNHAGYYSATQQLKFDMRDFTGQIKAFLTLGARPPDENANITSMSLGAGIGTRNDTNAPPLLFELSLAPTAFVHFANLWDATNQFEGGQFVVSNRAGGIRIEEATGRVIELTGVSEDPDLRYRLRFDPESLIQLANQTDADASGLSNAFEADKPWSSAAAFFAVEALQSRLLQTYGFPALSADTRKHLPLVIHQLLVSDVLAPLGRLQDHEPPAEAEAFLIPDVLESMASANSGFMAAGAEWLIHRSDQMFPPDSWPWTLAREAGFICKGDARHTEEALRGIYDSDQTGPLGYWATGRLLGQMNSPLAPRFAAKGLERLSKDDFGRDCRLLLEGDFIFNQCLVRLAEALRDLKPEELATLARSQTTARAQFLRECSHAMQARRHETVSEALAPALQNYWEAELRQQVARALRELALDANAAFAEGMKYGQGDVVAQNNVEAARWLRRAAEQDHPAAQFVLAQVCERGQGVPQNFSEALKWYRLAAANGHLDAQITLGNLYADGLSVAQDYSESFTWFSVATAQGSKLAQALRKSVQRKLTPDQLAEAERRAGVILQHKQPTKTH